MKPILSKKFWVFSLFIFIIFGILSFKIHDSYRQTANIVSAIQSSPTPSLTGTPLPAEDTQKLNPPKKVSLTGIAVAGMTYGRIRVRNLTPNTSFSYFIAEPDDVIEDGALRYSPTTRNIGDEPIKITGRMTDRCYWNDPEYFGCVPWVQIDKIEKLVNYPILRTKNSDFFGNLRWWTKQIDEKDLHANIYIAYPQFIGGPEVENLNSYIRTLFSKLVADNKKEVQGWVADKESKFWNDACGQEPVDGTIWPCSAQLKSKYTIKSIFNDIVSIELTIYENTGGGNGNHEYPTIINWDLKSDRLLKIEDLFCSNNFVSILSPLVYESILSQFKNPESLGEKFIGDLREEVSNSEVYSNISISRNGINIIYGPYTVLGGAVGIIRAPIPYSSIPGVVCLP